MDVVSVREYPRNGLSTDRVFSTPEGDVVMADLAFIGLTILIFALLFALVKGVERF
jgi:hypothetical protein